MADARLDGNPKGKRFVAVVALAAAVLWGVTTSRIPAFCPVRLLLHVPCPSCGLTRAAGRVMHLDFAGATQIHPLWWAVLPFVVIGFAIEARAYVVEGKGANHAGLAHVGYALAVALVLVWLARAAGAMGGPAQI